MATENDDVVITGISGRFPECNNIEEFKEALLNGIDLITIDDRRFPPGILGIPKRSGKLKDIESFDAGFFGVSPKQADFTDPRQRIILEATFEAIVDAGINPQELKGSKTGVYVGIGAFDSVDTVRENKTDGYANIGLSASVCANRISYSFDFKGPSYALDTACSSSLYAMANAVNEMRCGNIDNAIVAGASINLNPHETSGFDKLNMLSAEGKCQVFNKVRDGYARSEAIIAILLQRRSKARRLYATVLGAKTNCDGFKIEGFTYPSTQMQHELMKEIYSEGKFHPNDVVYIEAHGTGTPAGDIEECQAIVDMFCQNRKKPLPIGAVKSNMGHSEISSGLCSLAKVLIAMETGIIPANLHLTDPATDIPGINDGRLQVVSKNLPWDGGIVAMNCFGFGGANVHMALKSHNKEKTKITSLKTNRLVQVSGRTEEAVNHYLDQIQKHEDDGEFLSLIDQIHKTNIEGHNFRGYQVLGGSSKREINRCTKEKRPIWFVYTGMGSQWPGMGKDLMKIDIYRNSFRRCANALKAYGIDLEDIIVNGTAETFENITNSFCAIIAVEIALTDVLKAMDIVPDGIIGHSLGEVGCAYADGGLEPEQAVLLAYARGYASTNTNLPRGQMAAIGLSSEECQKLLPEDCIIACYNSSTSVTISGPEQTVLDLVKQFTEKGIFARLVNSGNYAFHSKYIADSGPLLLEFLKKIITNPKPRSEKWLSSSILENNWNSELAKYNSPEYHQNNFLKPVRFNQLLKHIPKNSIVIEVAPHALLQAILKRELGPEVTNIPLLNKTVEDNENCFFTNIGKVYINGGQPNLTKLYNKVSFPVCRGTTSISPMIKWDHSVKWYVPYFKVKDSFGQNVSINISDDEHSYLAGHTIDGRVLMPATGYMVMVWNVLAKMHVKSLEEFPVKFENVRFKRAAVLVPNQSVKFLINIMKQSGNFEIFESGSVVASGTITIPKDITKEFINPKRLISSADGYLPLETSDIYKEFNLRRYFYGGLFRGVKSCDINGSEGILQWNEKWTSFLDTMMQLTIIKDNHRELLLPTTVLKVVIDPKKHLKDVEEHKKEIPAFVNNRLNIVKAGGIEIIGMEASRAPRRQQIQAEPSLETYSFVPYENHNEQLDLRNSLTLALQIVLENNEGTRDLKISEAASSETKLSSLIMEIINGEPMSNSVLSTLKPTEKEGHNYDIIVIDEEVLNEFNIDLIKKNLRQNGFVLYRGKVSNLPSFEMEIVYANNITDGVFLLRQLKQSSLKMSVIKVKSSDLSWLEKAKEATRSKNYETVYLVSEDDDTSGIVGLIKTAILEPNGSIFKSVLICDKDVEMFSVDSQFYKKQLSKGLSVNILKNGLWGSFRHLPLKPIEQKEVHHACCNIQTPGDLSSFRWIQRPSKYYKHSPTSEECYVFYAALNFKDVMIASANLQAPTLPDPTAKNFPIGLEFSGITKQGKRVMGMVPAMGVALQVVNDPGFTWDVPDDWSLEEAATVPVVYATSYYALIHRGQMQQGESILIHAGAGGVGLSAISIALSMGCTVYTTVGSTEKREYIKKIFPQLKDENIGNSRNGSFEQMILENTNGKGVDLVLNCLAAELFQASLRCVANKGRFLEIGKADFMNGTPIDAKLFLKNCTFHGVLLDDLSFEDSAVKQRVNKILDQGIKSGVVKPLPRTVFKEDEVENAFRYLATGKHKGKVLIKIRDEEDYKGRSLSRTILSVPRIYMNSEKAYILIGGLGGFGLELANWLIERGATKIILNSRRNITTGYQSLCLKKWKEIGVNVQVNTDDTTTLKGAECLVTSAKKLGPIGGVFNMALVLKDALLENQTVEHFEQVFKTKIISGQNMDTVTRKLCPELKYFVVFSSVASGRGNPGQANYAMANAALEQLCEKRKQDSLPGFAVQWGPVGDVGYLANFDRSSDLYGMLPQNISSCLNSLEKFMLQSCAVGASTVLADKNVDMSESSGKTPAEAVAHILGLKKVDQVDARASLSELGLDSLMTAEIKQTLYRNYNIELDTDDIRNLTFNSLAKLSYGEPETVKNEEIKNEETPLLNGYTKPESKVILPVDEVITLNSITSDHTIFFIPPIEGNSKLLQPIAKKINSRCYGFQYTHKTNYNTISKYTDFFLNEIKNIQKQGPYVLCAYSYGCSIAFDVSLQLENEGHVVELIFIDGSPAYIKDVIIEKYLKQEENEDPQTANLKHFSRLFDNVNQDEVSKILDKSTSWETRVQEVSEMISDHTGYKVEELSDAAKGFYQRCYAGYYYKPSKILKGKVTLLKSSDIRNIGEDFGLNEICEQDTDVHQLQGDHMEVIHGENVSKIADIINKILLRV